jgi:3-phenylpropionate/trans-cinnamate dioxygenase ferredoxin subunit
VANARHDVCAADELPPGASKVVDVGGRSIGVFNVAGRYHALLNLCPHGGAPLCRGTVTGMSSSAGPGLDVDWIRQGEILRCPWHGWEYEIETGTTVTEPPLRVKTFAVSVAGGRVVVEV